MSIQSFAQLAQVLNMTLIMIHYNYVAHTICAMGLKYNSYYSHNFRKVSHLNLSTYYIYTH